MIRFLFEFHVGTSKSTGFINLFPSIKLFDFFLEIYPEGVAPKSADGEVTNITYYDFNGKESAQEKSEFSIEVLNTSGEHHLVAKDKKASLVLQSNEKYITLEDSKNLLLKMFLGLNLKTARVNLIFKEIQAAEEYKKIKSKMVQDQIIAPSQNTIQIIKANSVADKKPLGPISGYSLMVMKDSDKVFVKQVGLDPKDDILYQIDESSVLKKLNPEDSEALRKSKKNWKSWGEFLDLGDSYLLSQDKGIILSLTQKLLSADGTAFEKTAEIPKLSNGVDYVYKHQDRALAAFTKITDAKNESVKFYLNHSPYMSTAVHGVCGDYYIHGGVGENEMLHLSKKMDPVELPYLTLWNYRTGTFLSYLKYDNPEAIPFHVSFSKDCKTLYVLFYEYGKDYSLTFHTAYYKIVSF